VLLGMLLVAFSGSRLARRWNVLQLSLRSWTIGGCLASGLALAGLVMAGLIGATWPLKANVFLLGVTTGAFSIAAIGSMMRLATEGEAGREGVRMGLWGAAQALAFGIGGLVGTAASDLSRMLIGSTGTAYAAVFALEALMFCVAALLASRIGAQRPAISCPAGHSVPAPGVREPLQRGMT
jgi:BCD family chlorophyll transporter-like MFS transporter